jgi:DDE superfamily endonuclease
VPEFDDIYDKKITKKYTKHVVHHLSKPKGRKRDIGTVGRPFKLDLENRFLMILVYYRLYITYTLADFLFDLDQSNICRDIQKIESLIRDCVPILQKIYNKTNLYYAYGF